MKLKEILMVERDYNDMIDDHYLEVYVDAIKNEEVLRSRAIYIRRGEDGFYIFTVDFKEEKERRDAYGYDVVDSDLIVYDIRYKHQVAGLWPIQISISRQ